MFCVVLIILLGLRNSKVHREGQQKSVCMEGRGACLFVSVQVCLCESVFVCMLLNACMCLSFTIIKAPHLRGHKESTKESLLSWHEW